MCFGFLGVHGIRLIESVRPTSNAATMAALAGAAIRISPFASLVGTARESSTPRCLARIATPVTRPNQTARRENFGTGARSSSFLNQDAVQHRAAGRLSDFYRAV